MDVCSSVGNIELFVERKLTERQTLISYIQILSRFLLAVLGNLLLVNGLVANTDVVFCEVVLLDQGGLNQLLEVKLVFTFLIHSHVESRSGLL